MKFLLSLISLFVFLANNLTHIPIVKAQEPGASIVNDIRVTAQVPGFNLHMEGLFAPDSYVVLYNNNYLSGLGAFKTDGKGAFSFKISLGYTSPVELCLAGVDINEKESRPFCFVIEGGKSNYHYNKVFLSPTISLLSSSGENQLVVEGYTIPNSSVIIVIDKQVISNTKSDEQGYYSTVLSTGEFGDHEIYTYAVGPFYVTKESRYVYFTSEGTTYVITQEYRFIDSLYASIDSYFMYIFIPLFILLLLLLFLFWRKKKKEKDRPKADTSS